MEDDDSVHALRSIQGPHELGTHLHAAFIEPEKKFYDYAGVDSPDFQCHCPPDVEYRKLENLTQLFAQRFGYRPLTFRAGRFGAGPHTITALQRLGYRVDTSVTPHMLWKHPAGNVDYRQAPEQPYFPAPKALAVADSTRAGVLEIPVTIKPRWLRHPYWFRPWFASVQTMKDVIGYYLARYREQRVVVLNMMFHSMEVIPKASPYPQTEEDVQRFLNDLSEVMTWGRQQGMTFARAADVYPEFAA